MNILFNNRVAFIATMHHKEQVIAPLLEKELGLRCIVACDFDTDVFGTFTGEVERPSSQLDTLRMKCLKGLQVSGQEICIASEGAFGAHPTLSFLPADIEMVMLLDKKNDIEVTGQVLSTSTNFSRQTITSWEEAYQFAEQIGFPSHALVISLDEIVIKGINQWNILEKEINQLLKIYPAILLETDMRAMYNPTRMKVIQEATKELIKKLLSPCPQCGKVGFAITDMRLGLPCENCGLPTTQPLASIWECQKCHFIKEELYPNQQTTAEAFYCAFCNP